MSGLSITPGVPIDIEGHAEVILQDQHTEMVVIPLHVEINSGLFLASPTVVDDTTLTLTAGHGASVDDIIVIKETTHSYVSGILDFAGGANVPTMDTPLDYDFTTAAEVCVGNPNLNVLGSLASPIVAHASPPPGVQWDITRIHVRMIDNTVMDAGTFGGIAALTNGVVLRRTDGTSKNIGNAKTNGDMIGLASAYSFDEKPPSGEHGFTVNFVFGGQDHVGVTLRIDGATDDEVQLIIQDDLQGISQFRATAIGHVVTD
jgi:hypothetical protein